MSTPAEPDLITWLHQQFENQRFRGESLKTLAFALPPETAAYLTETGELLLADVDAKRRILDLAAPVDDPNDDEQVWYQQAISDVVRHLALPYADRPGFREEWRPA